MSLVISDGDKRKFEKHLLRVGNKCPYCNQYNKLIPVGDLGALVSTDGALIKTVVTKCGNCYAVTMFDADSLGIQG